MERLKNYILRETRKNKKPKTIVAVYLGQNIDDKHRYCVGNMGDYVFREDNVRDEEGDLCSEFFYITKKELESGKITVYEEVRLVKTQIVY